MKLQTKTRKNNKKSPFIPDHPYRILIIGGSGSGKTNALLNFIKEQNDIDNMYLDAKDLSEPRYKFLIKKREDVGTNISVIQMHLLSVQIKWMTFNRILMITTQAEKENS